MILLLYDSKKDLEKVSCYVEEEEVAFILVNPTLYNQFLSQKIKKKGIVASRYITMDIIGSIREELQELGVTTVVSLKNRMTKNTCYYVSSLRALKLINEFKKIGQIFQIIDEFNFIIPGRFYFSKRDLTAVERAIVLKDGLIITDFWTPVMRIRYFVKMAKHHLAMLFVGSNGKEKN